MLKAVLPQDKIQDFACDRDSVSFTAAMAGKVCIRIVEREPIKTIKFGGDETPVKFNLWIQLLSTLPYETKVRVTLHADIPFYLKPMIGNKLKDGVEKMAEMLTRLPY
jgi:carbon monoxide dehydrogenase subunit G